MGNQNKGVIKLAIIKKDGVKPYDKEDYNLFFQNKKIIEPQEYQTFEVFIQKQSLKDLHHILIVQGSEVDKTDADKKIDSDLPGYMVPVKKFMDNKGSTKKMSIPDKVINYIKKYSLEHLNLYFYVSELKNFVVSESQVPYVTLVSTKASKIINYIKNQKSEKLVNVKFKGLMKDLYRRKLVAVISKNYKENLLEKIKSRIQAEQLARIQAEQLARIQAEKLELQRKKQEKSKKKQNPKSEIANQEQIIRSAPQNQTSIIYGKFSKRQEETIYNIYKDFDQKNRFQYVIVESIDKFRDKIKSMYFDFIICMDQQNLLELIEFKKRMPVQSKIIYFGTKDDLTNQSKDLLPESAHTIKAIRQKKLSQIWWMSNSIEDQISPVIKKWWSNKYEIDSKLKYSTNIIIYVCRTQNIFRKKEIQYILIDKIQKNYQQRKLDFFKKINLTVEFKSDVISQRYTEALYTNIIMFDATNQEFQEMKKLIFTKYKDQPRIQVSMVQYNPKKAEQKQKHTDKTISQFTQRIQIVTKEKLQLKFEISPIQKIHCINLEEQDIEFFKNKMGLQVSAFPTLSQAQQLQKKQLKQEQRFKKILKNLEKSFPKYIDQTEGKNSISIISNRRTQKRNNQRVRFFSVFKNLLIICSFDDYLRSIFPFLMMANFFKENSFKEKFIFDTRWKKQYGQKCGQKCQQKCNAQCTYKPKQKQKWYSTPDFGFLSSSDFYNIKYYLNSVKVIIYGEADSQKKKKSKSYDLNKLLQIHENDASAHNCIQEAIYNFLNIKYTKDPSIKLDKPQKDKRIQNTDQIDNYIQWIKSQVFVAKEKGENQTDKKIVFPNIVFVHYKLSEIEQYLKFYKYSQLSVPKFPKDSLKEFSKAHLRVETIFLSKTFSLDATFVSTNTLLKDVFGQKNPDEGPKHTMKFLRFASNNQREMIAFQQYMNKYANLWKMRLKIFNKNQNGQFKEKDTFNLLKNDVKRVFQKCKFYELLKVTTAEFKHFYMDKIQKCQKLLDLQITAVYIYSLPHGVSDIVGAIFEDPSRSTLSLQIFNSFIFLLFANFYSIESRTLQKFSTVIYVSADKILNIYKQIRQNEIVINQSILHMLNNENESQNKKNHCIFIEYENLPWVKRSSLTPILKIENFAFYKEAAQFILAPFTKLKLKEKKQIDQCYNLYFEVITDDEPNIFLMTYFKVNGINDLSIFKAGNKQQDKETQENKKAADPKDQQKQTKQNPAKQKQTKQNPVKQNQLKQKQIQQRQKAQKKGAKPVQTQKHQSLYRQAEQQSLNEQKQGLRKSVQLTLYYIEMVYSLINNKVFSAEKSFYQIYNSTLNELNDNEDEQKRYEGVKEQFELNKLNVHLARLYLKMNQFSKAIRQLDILLQFLKFQKVEESLSGKWMKDKITEMKTRITQEQKSRQASFTKLKPVKIWNISMQQQQKKETVEGKQIQKKVTQTVVKSPTVKWVVSYDQRYEYFSLSSQEQPLSSQAQSKAQKYEAFRKQKEEKSKKQKEEASKKQKQQQWQINWSFWKNHKKQKYNTLQSCLSSQPSKSTNISKPKKINKQQQEEEPSKTFGFTMGDLFFKLLDDQAKRIPQFDTRRKGQNFDGDLKQMNQLFAYLHKTKQIRMLKIINVYAKFWKKIVDRITKHQRKVWKLLSQIPHAYIIGRFIQVVNKRFQQYQKITRQTRQKNKQSKILNSKEKEKYQIEKWFRDFLIELQKFDQKQIASFQQSLLEEYIERIQKSQEDKKKEAQKSQKDKKKEAQKSEEDKKKEACCWIDSLLDLQKQKRQWSVFEFDKKMIVVDAKRKWKQNVSKGLNYASKVFVRTESKILQLEHQKLKNYQLSQQSNT